MCHLLDNPVSLYGVTAPLRQHFMLIVVTTPSNTVHQFCRTIFVYCETVKILYRLFEVWGSSFN